jgi:hypothetical protein
MWQRDASFTGAQLLNPSTNPTGRPLFLVAKSLPIVAIEKANINLKINAFKSTKVGSKHE